MAWYSRLRRDPRVSLAVLGTILLFTAVYVVDLFGGLRLAYAWALMPGELTGALRRLPAAPLDAAAWTAIATLWLSTLVHAGPLHLAFNCLYFYFFGTLLAQITGARGMFAALLVASVTSGAAFVIHQGGDSPAFLVGASGAISGVSGLFVLLSFRWGDAPRVQTWPIARPVAPAQAALLALFSVAGDVYGLREGVATGVALDAHVGGFAGGLLLGALLTTFYPSFVDYRRSALAPGGGA